MASMRRDRMSDSETRQKGGPRSGTAPAGAIQWGGGGVANTRRQLLSWGCTRRSARYHSNGQPCRLSAAHGRDARRPGVERPLHITINRFLEQCGEVFDVGHLEQVVAEPNIGTGRCRRTRLVSVANSPPRPGRADDSGSDDRDDWDFLLGRPHDLLGGALLTGRMSPAGVGLPPRNSWAFAVNA